MCTAECAGVYSRVYCDEQQIKYRPSRGKFSFKMDRETSALDELRLLSKKKDFLFYELEVRLRVGVGDSPESKYG